MPEQIDEALLARKPSSLAGWQDLTQRGWILRATSIRTALLLAGWDGVTVKATPATGGATNYTINLTEAHGGTVGSAVPVTRDGYFLTAAHCVDDPRQLTVVALTHDLRLVKSAARVVWSSSQKNDRVDLALIHAPLELARPFPLADPAALKPGERVALSGWSKMGFKNSSGTAAGRILSVSRMHRQAGDFAWRIVEHDAPVNSGDSGGPLVTPDGNLAGINARAIANPVAFVRMLTGNAGSPDRPLAGYKARAFLPDRDWLRRTIEADRAARLLKDPTHRN